MICPDNVEIARLLLDIGMDINERDMDGNSALFYAITERKFNLIEFLLDNGAVSDDQDLDGFDIMTEGYSGQRIEDIQYMLEMKRMTKIRRRLP